MLLKLCVSVVVLVGLLVGRVRWCCFVLMVCVVLMSCVSGWLMWCWIS